jgi:hypothetical protein
MDAKPLPPCPNLEQYKKQAKDLLKACVSADPDAIHAWAERWLAGWADEWVETQARLRGVVVTQNLRESILPEQVDRIEKDIQAGKLSKSRPRFTDASSSSPARTALRAGPSSSSRFRRFNAEIPTKQSLKQQPTRSFRATFERCDNCSVIIPN